MAHTTIKKSRPRPPPHQPTHVLGQQLFRSREACEGGFAAPHLYGDRQVLLQPPRVGLRRTPEFLYARTWTSEHQSTHALTMWNIHYNYHRPHNAAGNQPPATRLHANVTNLMTSYN